MILMILSLLIGFICLVKGADVFVDGACGISAKLKIPSFLVGLTVVAFGTSLPEAAVSITAALSGSNGIALGNVVGSNIFNTLVVIGASALFTPVFVKNNMLKKDFPFSIILSGILLFLCLDLGNSQKTLSRNDGLALLLFFAWFLYESIRSAKANPDADELPEFKGTTLKCILFVLLGLAGVILGGQLTVYGAKNLALAFGLSESVVGLTVVAIGTSLPELVTSIAAARKGQNDIAMGNVIGSNIFNILFILGASSSLCAIPVDGAALIDIGVMLGITVAVYLVALARKKIVRPAGAVMILGYVAYTAYLLMR